jgi:hypothetical protein
MWKSEHEVMRRGIHGYLFIFSKWSQDIFMKSQVSALNFDHKGFSGTNWAKNRIVVDTLCVKMKCWHF